MKLDRRGAFAILLFCLPCAVMLLKPWIVEAQYSPTPIRSGAIDPAVCTPASGPTERKLFYNTTTSKAKYCCAPNTWCEMGGGSPGGANTQVQFNDSGAFGGDAGLVYDKTLDNLTLLGSLTALNFATSGLGGGGVDMTNGTAPAAAAAHTVLYSDNIRNAPMQSLNNGDFFLSPCAVNDPKCLDVSEEFVGGQTGGGLLGELGWGTNNIGAALTNTNFGAAWPRLGALKSTTTATGGQGGSVYLGGSGGGYVGGNWSGNTLWHHTWIFRLNQTAGATTFTRFRLGLIPAATGSVEPTDGIWIRYDTNAAYSDAAFHVVCRSSSVNTEPAGPPTYAVVPANWYVVQLYSTTAGTVFFKLDANAPVSIASGCPTANLGPGYIIVTDTTSARDLQVDKYTLAVRGLAR